MKRSWTKGIWAGLGAALSLSLSGCAGVAFSPDGQTIAFTWPLGKETHVALVGIDGAGFRYIAGTKGVDPVAWSSDGRRLLAASYNEGREGGPLLSVGIESGRVQTVSLRAAPVAAWTDSPNRIVYYEKGSEGVKSGFVWYDLSTKKETHRVAVTASEPDRSHGCQWLAASDGVAFVGEDRNVYAILRGEVIRVTSTGDVVGMRADATGRSLSWARRSRNPRYILLSLYSFRLSDRTVRKLPFPDRVASINPGPRSGPTEVEHVAFAPSLREFAILTKEQSGQAPAVHSVFRVDIEGRSGSLLGRYVEKERMPAAFAWSPSEGRIAILEAQESSMRLMLMEAGRAARALKTVQTEKTP